MRNENNNFHFIIGNMSMSKKQLLLIIYQYLKMILQLKNAQSFQNVFVIVNQFFG